jgi:hypothetical protein
LVETSKFISAFTANKRGYLTISWYILKLTTMLNVFIDILKKSSVSNNACDVGTCFEISTKMAAILAPTYTTEQTSNIKML